MRVAVFLTLSILQGQSWYEVQTFAGAGDTGDGRAATSARFLSLSGIAVDPTGNVYLSDTDTHRVRRVSPAGIVTNFAGTGVAGLSGDGGPAASAALHYPYGLAADYAGNVYIADLGNARVRKVTPDGKISTVAGHTAETKLIAPRNVAVDGPGNVLISDFGAHRVYRLGPSGLVPFAGVGRTGDAGDGGLATAAFLHSPAGLAFDPAGNLYIGDTGNKRVRRVTLDGRISTVTAEGLQPIVATGMTHTFAGELWLPDGTGGTLMQVVPQQSAVAYPFAAMDAASDFAGNVYAAGGNIVRRIGAKDKKTAVFAGGLPFRFGGDGDAAVQARMNRPSGLAMDPATGIVYIADSGNGRVRRVFPITGGIDTILEGFSSPQGLWWDAKSNTLYVADAGANAVYRWKPGWATQEAVLEGEAAGLKGPLGVTVDDAGDLWIADTGNGRLRVVNMTTGAVRTALSGLQQPTAVVWSAGHTAVFVAESGAGQVLRVTPNRPGAPMVIKADGVWVRPRAIALESTGALLVADEGSNRVTRTVIADGGAQVIAGNGEAGFDGDVKNFAVAAKFDGLTGLLIDSAGRILVSDSGNHRVRALTVGGDSNAPVVTEPPVVQPTGIAILHGASKLPVSAAAPGMLLAVPADGEYAIQGRKVVFVGEGLIQVPANVAALKEFELTYSKLGTVLERRWIQVVSAAPGIFPGIVNTADGSLNSAESPIPRGTAVTLRVTGEGSGELRVRIRGTVSTILDRQAAPDLPGATDLTVRVPSGFFGAGAATVVVDAGNGAVSQEGVTIWIR
ncbi:hypothetical protein F183_A20110 [Bryobacterales bacterium F-183]|nr:hypothetical protein F183_A20110 [Bryobacterales bacterium F-183]